MMTSLIVIENLTPAEIFKDDSYASIIEKIKQEALSEIPDVNTKKGRDRIKSIAHKVAKSKTALDNMGKELTQEWKSKAKKVDDSRKSIREQLDDLKEQVRKPLTDWENAEKERTESLDKKISVIKDLCSTTHPHGHEYSAAELKENLQSLHLIMVDNSYQEREEEARLALKNSIDLLEARIIKKEKADQVEAEIERENREREEREKAEREAEIARRAEEAARNEEREKARLENEMLERRRKDAEERAAKAEQRIIEEKKAEEARKERERAEKEARESDLENRRQKNKAALKCFLDQGFGETEARKIIKLVASGMIENITINY